MGSTEAQQDQGTVLGELDAVEEDAGRGLLGVALGEGAKVVHAHEEGRRRAHAVDVQGVLDPPDEGLAEGGATAGDLVEVAACHGVVSRMEAPGDLLDGQDVDVGRKVIVESVPQGDGGEARLQVEVGDLAESVDACVGAPRPVDLEVGAVRHRPHRRGQLPLDGAGVLLDLPSAVARPRELEDELEAAHLRRS